KMAAARAEIALLAEGPDAATEWAQRAIDMALPVGRRKYETAARTTLGQALAALGRLPDAVAELENAVRDADRLGSPPGRWRTPAALGKALSALGRDEQAERAFQGAAQEIRDVGGALSAERAERVLRAPAIAESRQA